MGLLLLVLNENDGFQNLWFFLMPATLFVQSGLPIGLPFCTAYGLAATCFLWLGPLAGSTLYRRDYALFYPAAYWSFCLLMITADIFYKHYRIRQEQSEKEMEREVRATICEARQLMVSSVAAISQMIDEKDRYTSEHSHRVGRTMPASSGRIWALPARSWTASTGAPCSTTSERSPCRTPSSISPPG